MALVDDALYYRDLGWVTTPLINDDQGYPKKPFVDGWQREVLGDVPGLPWDQAIGLGVVLGAASGNLAVIDLDDIELAERAALVFSGHYFVRTARGRGHLYVREADGPSPSRAVKVQYQGRTVGIELKAIGTQVAAPPSPGYGIWNQGPVLRASSVAAAFNDLCTLVGIEAPPSASAAGYPSPWMESVPDLERNNAQFVEACRLAEARMPFDEAVEIMRLRFQVAYEKNPAKDRNGERAMLSTIRSAYQTIWREHQTKAAPPPDVSTSTPMWEPRSLVTGEEVALAVRDTFVDSYVRYASQRTDAPNEFHEALGLTLLSVVIGRRAVLRLSNATVYPSLWILILADSTLYRKSTAMDLARDLLERVDRERLTPNDFTPQRFIALLAEQDGHPLLFVRDEFSGFYDALNRLDFMAGLKETLMNVYDGRPFRREKMRKDGKDDEWKYDVREPFLSLAVATTEERFSEVARVNDVHSGFLPRFAFIKPPAAPPRRRLIRELSTTVEFDRDILAQRLRTVAGAEVSVTADPGVFERFDQYSADIEDEAREAPDGNLVAIVGARIAWMAMRIAILLGVADGTNRVALPHLLRGIATTEPWRHNTLRVLSALAPSKFERQLMRAVQLVERKGEEGISRRDTMRFLRINKREMDEIESTVRERGDFQIRVTPTSGGPTTRYVP